MQHSGFAEAFLRAAALRYHRNEAPATLTDDPQRLAASERFWEERYNLPKNTP